MFKPSDLEVTEARFAKGCLVVIDDEDASALSIAPNVVGVVYAESDDSWVLINSYCTWHIDRLTKVRIIYKIPSRFKDIFKGEISGS